MSPRGVVFLDRDGVLTIPLARGGKGYAPRRFSDFELYPDASESVSRLVQDDWTVFVVTNQPDVGAGLITQSELDTMHNFLRNRVLVTDILVCPHTAADSCGCRKPKAGLLLKASERFSFGDRPRWMVGDRDSDVAAGDSFDCKTIFIDRKWSDEKGDKADYRVGSLTEAVDTILSFHAGAS